MRRLLQITISLALLFLMATPAFAGELLDGVVASVNRKPILRSDWGEAIAFEAFMRQKPVSQVTEGDRVLALQHMIDRQLLRAQMGDETYLQPSEQALQQDVAKLREQLPNGKDDAAWQKLLASYGLDERTVIKHLSTEVQVMNFVEVRLRPNVHVDQDEVESYYNKQLLPDLQANGAKAVPLNDVSSKIRELLTEQSIDELLDTWLHNLRQQSEIRSTVVIPGINAPAEGARAAGIN